MLSSRFIPFVRFFLLTSQSMSGVVFRLNHPEAIFSEYFVVPSFLIRSPIILYSCLFVRLHILPVLCSLISLRSLRSLVSRFPQVSSCFSNSFRWFILFSSFVSIPTVARSRFFLLLSYQFIHSFQPYRWFTKTFSSFALYSTLIFPTRISSMQIHCF